MNIERKKSSKLSLESRKKLRASDFGIPGEREFPMPDSIHVRAAEAYFKYAPEDKKPQLAYRIVLKAKKFGVKIEDENVLDWASKYKK
jgi:hypothetical protein